jgi:hypothetical protein
MKRSLKTGVGCIKFQINVFHPQIASTISFDLAVSPSCRFSLGALCFIRCLNVRGLTHILTRPVLLAVNSARDKNEIAVMMSHSTCLICGGAVI